MNMIEVRIGAEACVSALERDGHIWDGWTGAEVHTHRRPFHTVIEWCTGIDVRWLA